MPDSLTPGVQAIRQQLTGRWRRVTASSSSVPYPDEISFAPNGLYHGTRGEDGRDFTVWDVGRTDILSDHEIRISTANDKEIVYRFHLAADDLTITDAESAELTYRRIG